MGTDPSDRNLVTAYTIYGSQMFARGFDAWVLPATADREWAIMNHAGSLTQRDPLAPAPPEITPRVKSLWLACGAGATVREFEQLGT